MQGDGAYLGHVTLREPRIARGPLNLPARPHPALSVDEALDLALDL